MQGRYGGGRVAQVLRGEDDPVLRERALDKLSTFGLLRDWSAPAIRVLLEALAAEGCVAVSADEYRTLAITPLGIQVARRQVALTMTWPPGCPLEAVDGGQPTRPGVRKTPADRKGGPAAALVVASDGATTARLERLRMWRTEEARARSVPAYCVLNNRTVAALAQHHPQSLAELEDIPGMGPVLCARHGETVLRLLKDG